MEQYEPVVVQLLAEVMDPTFVCTVSIALVLLRAGSDTVLPSVLGTFQRPACGNSAGTKISTLNAWSKPLVQGLGQHKAGQQQRAARGYPLLRFSDSPRCGGRESDIS